MWLQRLGGLVGVLAFTRRLFPLRLMGGVWTLQGVGILPGSYMTGQTFWAVVGLLLLIAGATLCYAATRLSSRRR